MYILFIDNQIMLLWFFDISIGLKSSKAPSGSTIPVVEYFLDYSGVSNKRACSFTIPKICYLVPARLLDTT